MARAIDTNSLRIMMIVVVVCSAPDVSCRGTEAVMVRRSTIVLPLHLRQKLEDDPAQPKHLLTETAVGYRLLLQG